MASSAALSCSNALLPAFLRPLLMLVALLALVQVYAAHACPEGMEPITEMVPAVAAGPSPGGWVPVTRCIPSAAPATSGPVTGAPLTNVRGVNNTGAIALWTSATGETGYSFSRWGSPNIEKTQTDVVEICQKDGGANCAASLACWNCHITVARDAGGRLRAASGATKRKAENEMKKMCRQDKVKCAVIETREFLAYGVNTAY